MDYRERNKWYITASKLKLFLDSPLLYKAIYIDEVDTSNIKDVPALEIWAMVDKYILTPDEFKKEYAFQVWWLKDELINYCNEKWIQLTGKEKVDDLKTLIYWDKKVLTQSQEDVVLWIASELTSQPLFDWKWNYECQKELYGEWNWIKIKWTLDRFAYTDWVAFIRDLKTTSQMYYNAYSDNTQFYNDLATRDPFHYKLQMALYVWLVKQNYPDVKHIDVVIDAVWTSDPYFYQWIKMNVNELEDVWELQIIPLLQDLYNLDQWIVQWYMPSVATNRNKLSGNRYYKLWTEDCIQTEWEYIWWPQEVKNDIPKPDETPDDFDWDSI